MAEWFIWPPAQFVNFYFLPTRLRVIYDNTISLGYDMYTSHVKNSNRNTQISTKDYDGTSNKASLQSKHMIAKDIFSAENELQKHDSWCC